MKIILFLFFKQLIFRSMITKENVHITSLPIDDETAALSKSLTPLEKLESILRQEYNSGPPSSFSDAWRKFDEISALIESASESVLEEFFSCNHVHSLTSLAGDLLTLAKDDKTMLTAVRALLSRLSTMGSKLNRMQQARISTMKYSDTFLIFSLSRIFDSRVRVEKIIFFEKMKTNCKLSSTISNLVGKLSPKIAPPLPKFPKIGLPGKLAGPPPPVIGKLSAPAAGKVACATPPIGKALIVGKVPGPPKLPSGLGKLSGPPLCKAHESLVVPSTPVFPAPLIDPGSEFRKVHWQSIPVSRFEKSIFNKKIFGNNFLKNIDFELIKKHFVREKAEVKTPVKSREPATAAGTPVIGSSSPQISLPSVLDQKRIQQIEIFLTKYRNLTRPVLESLVRNKDQDKDSCVELLESILALFPTIEEQSVLETVCNNPLPLAKADKFLVDLSINIPEFKTAAAARIILSTFSSSFSDLSNYLKNFNSKVLEITSSNTLVDVFRIIGSLVVFLGNRKSVFNGFGIDNLSSLKKINSFIIKDYSSFHVVVDMLSLSELDSIATLLSDESAKSVLESDFDEILIQVTELEKAVNSRLGKIDFVSKDFYAEMIREINLFMNENCSKIDSLVLLRDAAKMNAKLIREYFGENDKKSINEIFGSLKMFGNDLLNARKRSRN